MIDVIIIFLLALLKNKYNNVNGFVKNITKLLMALDRGNYIRQLDNYKKILTHFDFYIAKNRYLRFPYDHLVSTKNIDKNIISDVFK